MSSLEEIREARAAKRDQLSQRGITPYPNQSERNCSSREALERFEELASAGEEKTMAGRVISLRGQGALSFVTIDDGEGRFQGVLQKGEVSDEESRALFVDTVDVGDIVEITGPFFRTKRGTDSLQIRSWAMLSKSLRPLPEKWYGFKDQEERYRKRYLDLLMNPDLKDLFVKKAAFWKTAREFLEEKGFTEVHTPTLEETTGGAEARPFKTHHNDSGEDLYLRISAGELWQKRLMAAGFPRTYEIGRVYRNEGSSPEHLQEFTNLEFYAAYLNFEDGMAMVTDLYRALATEVLGTTAFSTRGHDLDLSDEWQEYDYVSTVKEKTGADVLEATDKELESTLKELEIEYDGATRERMIDSLWKYCRKQISGPGFLINHPRLMAPLSKLHPDDNRLTKTFQPILAGSEVGRGHAELNDPADQAERFRVQQELIEAGDEEAMMPDWEYVEMLEHGMPPTFGFGFGERFFSFLVDRSIRETTLFPFMKRRSADSHIDQSDEGGEE